MRTASTRVRVGPNAQGGWDIHEPGRTKALARCATKEAAVLRTYGLMITGGQVQVVDADGFLQETRTVPRPGDLPWWYVPTWRWQWVLSALFVLVGAYGVVIHHVAEFRFWLYVAQALLGLTYLIVRLRSRSWSRWRLQRDAELPGTQPDAAERVEPNGPERRT